MKFNAHLILTVALALAALTATPAAVSGAKQNAKSGKSNRGKSNHGKSNHGKHNRGKHKRKHKHKRPHRHKAANPASQNAALYGHLGATSGATSAPAPSGGGRGRLGSTRSSGLPSCSDTTVMNCHEQCCSTIDSACQK